MPLAKINAVCFNSASFYTKLTAVGLIFSLVHDDKSLCDMEDFSENRNENRFESDICCRCCRYITFIIHIVFSDIFEV